MVLDSVYITELTLLLLAIEHCFELIVLNFTAAIGIILLDQVIDINRQAESLAASSRRQLIHIRKCSPPPLARHSFLPQ
jgi:hypothetical protein